MPRRSNVEKLSPELRAKLNELLSNPNVTQAQVADMVNEWAGEDVVSKSGVNRYAAQMAKFTERSRQALQVANAFINKFGTDTGNVLGKVINEQIRLIAFDLVTGIEEVRESGAEDAAQMAADMMLKISKAINELEKAEKLNFERSEAIRKATLAEAAAAVEKSAKGAGLSPETVDQFKKQILGL